MTDISQQTKSRFPAADGLIFFYGLWAISALGRAVYQYGFRRPADATPTHISTFVGLLYLAIIVGLRRRSARAWWLTLALLGAELVVRTSTAAPGVRSPDGRRSLLSRLLRRTSPASA